jgi:hypothetical protein
MTRAELLTPLPSTVITVIAFRDHDPDLAASSVVPGHLLCATDIRVVYFESLAWVHLSEGILFIALGV